MIYPEARYSMTGTNEMLPDSLGKNDENAKSASRYTHQSWPSFIATKLEPSK